jgi:predicted nucleic acid-binding protein
VTARWERATPELKDDMAGRGYIYGKTGHHDRAREILDRIESRAKKEYVSPQNLALVLGEHEHALDLREKAFEERDVRLVFLKVVPTYDPLRRDPRFQRVLERMSFPD